MAFSTYIVRDKFKNATVFDSGRSGIVRSDGTTFQFHANRNNVVIVDFPNDDVPSEVHTYYMTGDNLDDDAIAKQAHFIVESLNAQDAGLGAITVNQVLQPKVPDQVLVDLKKKQVAYADAARDAIVEVRNIPKEIQALADLKAAEDAAAQANAAAAALAT